MLNYRKQLFNVSLEMSRKKIDELIEADYNSTRSNAR
jgi:hypothetical protein